MFAGNKPHQQLQSDSKYENICAAKLLFLSKRERRIPQTQTLDFSFAEIHTRLRLSWLGGAGAAWGQASTKTQPWKPDPSHSCGRTVMRHYGDDSRGRAAAVSPRCDGCFCPRWHDHRFESHRSDKNSQRLVAVKL